LHGQFLLLRVRYENAGQVRQVVVEF